jgi:2-octaprenyl-6-methoxyphenol hydroxylase
MGDALKFKADVVIAGGGMVGLTLGIALAEAGIETVVVDAADPEQVFQAGFDGRVSSFAPASRRLLSAISVWDHLEHEAEPVLDIVVGDGSVREGASPALLHFDHREHGPEPLAHMIENRHFRIALEKRARSVRGLRVIAPAKVLGADAQPAQIVLSTSAGHMISAQLCVAADGRDSPLRQAAGIKTFGWPYRQHGIVATIDHERPHRGVAHELFLEAGPFAILPMKGNRSSIVWSEEERRAAAYMALDDNAFLSEVRQRFGDQWGEIRLAGPRWSYPLTMQIATSYLAQRLAVVGDAAHAVHPLAGQGLNLGLRDVGALAEVIVETRRLGLDVGSPPNLARYEAWRRFDNTLFALSMDGLNRLFSNSVGPLQAIRRLGLDLVDGIPSMKALFMRQAAGEFGSMPRLLKGESL